MIDTECFLANGRVDVWLLSLSNLTDDERIEHERILTIDERVRAGRYLVQHARDQFSAARALLRTRLFAYTGESAECWRFEQNAYGRPQVAAPHRYHDIRFNISHTDGLVACAFTIGRELGIDVEATERELDVLGVARSHFAPLESDALSRFDSESRLAAFFSYWTLKESYIKARGIGLSLPLDSFWFELGEHPPRLHCAPRCEDVPERWRFLQSHPTHGHALALTVEARANEKLDVRINWLAPSLIPYIGPGPSGNSVSALGRTAQHLR